MTRPLASVSLDVDNLWSYMKTHGDAGWEARPTYLPTFSPIALEALDRLGIKITFFIVGLDAAREENVPALRAFVTAGHEVGNHSYEHEPWLHLYAPDQLEREIAGAETAIHAATGQKPIGFRGPGFSWSPELLRVLSQRGYLYDASTFPTFLGPLARAYYFWTAKLSKEEREKRSYLFGSLSEGFRPNKPYHWNLDGGRTLLEIPVTTMPVFKVPFHFSYLLYLARYSEAAMAAYLRTAVMLCRGTGLEPSFLLHPLDLLSGEEAPALAFFPGMDVTSRKKVELFERVLRVLGEHFELVNMSTHARALMDRKGGAAGARRGGLIVCGFVGILTRPDRPVDADILAAMAYTIRHRGPDGEGQQIDDRVGLHHKRLAIIDLATGQQPMTSGPFTIVFNGEIYNYVELREDLRRRGHEFKTQSDTEVILRLYAEHGEGCVKLLNGMFAFLLYDRERGIVLAARDHFGIKPLYYAEIGGQLCYASEIKALMRHPEALRAPNTEALHDYLTFQFVLGDASLFRGVRKVLPGHYQVVDLASLAIRTEKFWEPTFRLDPYHTEEYFVEEVRRLLNDAVRLQMRSDVPVGCYLSGGMDSSLVTLMAAPHVGGRLHTFSGAFKEGPEFNELDYAREVARTCGAESHEIFPTEQEFCDLLPKLVYHMDEPVAGPGLFPQYIVSRMAQKQVKVCLGGQGGDEIFGGYTRYLVAYFEQALKGAIFETNEEQEHIVSLRSIVPNLAALKQYVPMLKQFWNDELFQPMDRRYFRLIDRSGGALGLLSNDFRAGYHPEKQFGRFQDVFNHPETSSYYNKMTHFDMVTTLPALLQVEDRVSMAVSLESRVPLLDYRLADLVASMPPAMKFRGGEMKYILKKAVQHTLPDRILERKDKMGFPVPLHLWARGRARDFFHDILLSQRCRERGIYDLGEVEKLLGNEAAFGRRLWGLLNLELWHRQFMDAD